MIQNNEQTTTLRKLLLIVNQKAGGDVKEKTQELVISLLQQQSFSIQIAEIQDLNKLRQQFPPNIYAVVILGGDGTVRTVVNKLHDRQALFAIIPCGTFNHLAKDLNISDDIASCVAMIVAGHYGQIDLAEVNGHYFVNNSSIGLYPSAVKYRRLYFGWPKWLAMIVSLLKIFRTFHVFKVQYVVENQTFEVLTPLVFIANNAYQLNFLKLTHRETLTTGQLVLYINQATSRMEFLKLISAFVFRRRHKIPGYFRMQPVTSCQLVLSKTQVDVALDGEVIKLKTPLHYRLHPRKLNILVPEI